ncbi:MAG TPA: DUF1573 domain-containing protein [Verrucomicrobiae bacterium]|nr:DUF1573 domain-containing protein [Verrucomicrobiae bacterium]
MKGLLIFSAAFASFAGVTLAQPLATDIKPKIQFQELIHDFGKIKANEPQRTDFLFTNTGNSVLEVTDVRPGCGCTTAGQWDRKVEPGKVGKIPIQFNPGAPSGTVTKSISVTCNDPVQNVQTLQVKATIWKPVDVNPAYVYFMGVEGEVTNDTKVVKITNNLEESITLEKPESNNPNFKTELKTLTPGKEYELSVTYVPTTTNSPPQSMITMKSTSTNLPIVSVTAYAMPQPAVVAMPQAIRLPAGPLSPNYRQPVTIRNNSTKPITLTDPAVNAEGVTVQTTETQPGKLFTLNVTFPTNFTSKPDMALTVKTSHPKYPTLKVPFIQASIPTPGAVPPSAVRPINATNAVSGVPRPVVATITNAGVRAVNAKP